MEKKITKKEKFEMLKGVLANVEVDGKEMLMEFLDNELTRVSKVYLRKEKEDTLKDDVYALVTVTGVTNSEIVAALGMEDVTPSKVTARLTKLIKEGLVMKETEKRDDKKVTVYYLANKEASL